MPKKTIIFDLDGTLTDSGEGIIKTCMMVLEHYGLPVPGWEEMKVFVGPPLHLKLQEFGVPASEADNAVELYRTRYNTVGKFENTPYPGIYQLLERLKSKGYQLLVATAKPEVTSMEILEHFDLARYFDKICGASLDRSRSEKTAVLAYLLEQVEVGDAIMVGDTHFDVLGAASHGIPTIGVSWGYGQVQDMIDAGAKAIAYSMDQLEQLLTVES